MLTKKTILTSAVAAMLFFSANTYAKYYQITDTATGKVYYAKSISHEKCGVIKFKDSRTSQTVTLPSTSVEKINKAAFKHALRT
jgi:hypothetical protein